MERGGARVMRPVQVDVNQNGSRRLPPLMIPSQRVNGINSGSSWKRTETVISSRKSPHNGNNGALKMNMSGMNGGRHGGLLITRKDSNNITPGPFLSSSSSTLLKTPSVFDTLPRQPWGTGQTLRGEITPSRGAYINGHRTPVLLRPSTAEPPLDHSWTSQRRSASRENLFPEPQGHGARRLEPYRVRRRSSSERQRRKLRASNDRIFVDDSQQGYNTTGGGGNADFDAFSIVSEPIHSLQRNRKLITGEQLRQKTGGTVGGGSMNYIPQALRQSTSSVNEWRPFRDLGPSTGDDGMYDVDRRPVTPVSVQDLRPVTPGVGPSAVAAIDPELKEAETDGNRYHVTMNLNAAMARPGLGNGLPRTDSYGQLFPPDRAGSRLGSRLDLAGGTGSRPGSRLDVTMDTLPRHASRLDIVDYDSAPLIPDRPGSRAVSVLQVTGEPDTYRIGSTRPSTSHLTYAVDVIDSTTPMIDDNYVIKSVTASNTRPPSVASTSSRYTEKVYAVDVVGQTNKSTTVSYTGDDKVEFDLEIFGGRQRKKRIDTTPQSSDLDEPSRTINMSLNDSLHMDYMPEIIRNNGAPLERDPDDCDPLDDLDPDNQWPGRRPRESGPPNPETFEDFPLQNKGRDSPDNTDEVPVQKPGRKTPEKVEPPARKTPEKVEPQPLLGSQNAPWNNACPDPEADLEGDLQAQHHRSTDHVEEQRRDAERKLILAQKAKLKQEAEDKRRAEEGAMKDMALQAERDALDREKKERELEAQRRAIEMERAAEAARKAALEKEIELEAQRKALERERAALEDQKRKNAEELARQKAEAETKAKADENKRRDAERRREEEERRRREEQREEDRRKEQEEQEREMAEAERQRQVDQDRKNREKELAAAAAARKEPPARKLEKDDLQRQPSPFNGRSSRADRDDRDYPDGGVIRERVDSRLTRHLDDDDDFDMDVPVNVDGPDEKMARDIAMSYSQRLPASTDGTSAFVRRLMKDAPTDSVRQRVNIEREETEIRGPLPTKEDGGTEGLLNVDTVSEKVDMTLQDGIAELVVKVRCERIVPIRGAADLYKKSSVIVSRVIDVDLTVTAERRELYEQVMANRRSENRISNKDTFELYKAFMELAEADESTTGGLGRQTVRIDKKVDEERFHDIQRESRAYGPPGDPEFGLYEPGMGMISDDSEDYRRRHDNPNLRRTNNYSKEAEGRTAMTTVQQTRTTSSRMNQQSSSSRNQQRDEAQFNGSGRW